MDPYAAACTHSTIWQITRREEIKKNMESAMGQIRSAYHFCGFDFPLKLIAIGEGALTGWTDAMHDYDHPRAIRELYGGITVPGEETDKLGELSSELGIYLIGQIQSVDPDLMEGRYFNTAFITDPRGKVIYKKHKTSLFPGERVTCPTDIWDAYIQKYGNDPKKLLDAVWPVARTEIGNIGTLICGEGDKPEAARALAMNGAEIIWRGTYFGDTYVPQFELANRSHAMFNTCYVLAPGDPVCLNPPHLPGAPSSIIDYKGNVIAQTTTGAGDKSIMATINIEELRQFRVKTRFLNFLSQLRIEQYILPYQYALDQGGIYPKNLAMDEPPMTRQPHYDLLRYNVNKLVELGIWVPPEGWKPYPIAKDVLDRIEKARSRSYIRA